MLNQIKFHIKKLFFSKLINDYIEENDSLSDKISFPNLDNFYNQIKNKSKQNLDRKLLLNVLKQQIQILLSKFSKKYRTIVKKILIQLPQGINCVYLLVLFFYI